LLNAARQSAGDREFDEELRFHVLEMRGGRRTGAPA
jgi:hypothetical protein